MLRALLLTATAVAAAAAPTWAASLATSPHPPPQHAADATATAYRAPLPEPLHVLTRFAPPATPYGPGHLGVDLAAGPGEVVRAAGAGVVQFAGAVAGRGVVVIAHPDGIRTEYEPLRVTVRVGTRLRPGAPIGIVDGRHTGCREACLHWGARRGALYLDPLGLLRRLGPVVLLPWAAAQARGWAR